ncbi:hypothetical protein F6455_06990 [Proteobacteria bacterium 005FR1]|nr:hypothetical protein [Proteobacteria bacterium 005FR1]
MHATSPQAVSASRFLWLNSKQHAVVSGKALLALYLVIPACGLLVAADTLLFDNRLMYLLPTSPSGFFIWAVVFELPHIVAGLFTFCDREYIRCYRKKLISSLSIITAAVLFVLVGAPVVLPASLSDILSHLLSAVFVVYTMYHLFSQQFGISMALMKLRPDRRYEWLRWGATLSGVLMYALVMVDKELMFVGVSFGAVFQWLCAGIIAFTCVLGWNVSKLASDTRSKLFLFANLAMLVTTYLFLYMDYSIFVIMIPRFVHDLTAFYVYGVHDHNRNGEQRTNFIYRPFHAVSPILISPVLALVVGNVIESTDAAIPALALIVTFFHYHIEGVIWKGNSLHRQFVSFR